MNSVHQEIESEASLAGRLYRAYPMHWCPHRRQARCLLAVYCCSNTVSTQAEERQRQGLARQQGLTTGVGTSTQPLTCRCRRCRCRWSPARAYVRRPPSAWRCGPGQIACGVDAQRYGAEHEWLSHETGSTSTGAGLRLASQHPCVDVPCETPHKQWRSKRIVLGAHEVQEGLPTPQGNEQAQVANEVICHGQAIGVRPGHKSTAPRRATYTSQGGCQKQRWYLSSGWLQIYC